MRLIVTRPEPDGERTARALIGLGHVPILSPMLDIRFDTDVKFPERSFGAVLVTSTNAVRGLASNRGREQIAGLPLLAVGDRTALAAKRAGFSSVRSAGGTVDELVALATAELRPEAGPLLYAAGDVQAGDLAGRLTSLGFNVDTATVYRAEPRLRLSGVAAEALTKGNVDGVLVYSQRSALAFAGALRSAGLDPLAGSVTCFGLSAAAAEPLESVAAGPILVAERPDQLSLFALIERSATSRLASQPRLQ